LCAQAGQAQDAVAHLLALLDPGEKSAPFTAERAEAIETAVSDCIDADLHWPDAAKPGLLAALRSSEALLPEPPGAAYAGLYLALGDAASAARLTENLDPDAVDYELAAEIG